jgi:hypothetical protein
MAGVHRARHAGIRCLRQDDIRPHKHQTANKGQRRFHDWNIRLFSKKR